MMLMKYLNQSEIYNCNTTTTTAGRKEQQQDYSWPIFVASENLEPHKAPLKPGDMLVYRGERLDHWRLPFDGVNNGQVFLHYNKAEDKDNLYDGRPELGLTSGFKKNNG